MEMAIMPLFLFYRKLVFRGNRLSLAVPTPVSIIKSGFSITLSYRSNLCNSFVG